MSQIPFYNPEISYEENFEKGPFGSFSDEEIYTDKKKPEFNFLGHNVSSLFGIPAGPLINGKFVKAALDKGFDIVTYKTVRSGKYPCHPWPNVVGVAVEKNLTFEKAEEGIKVLKEYKNPLSITNSFGVPSFDPDFWQKDMKEAVEYGKTGQLLIGSFQGTPQGDAVSYIKDFANCARLVKETGAKVLEVNLSCPNEGNAHLLCFDLERVEKVVEMIKNEIGDTPLIIKIAYFKDDEMLKTLIQSIGKKVEGIEAINTIPAKIVDEKGGQFFPGNGRLKSGVCGSSIKWAGLEMVKKLKKLREELSLNYTIIGVGGVTKKEDYDEYREAGADAVLSATGAMWNPYLAQEIKREM